ncbi:hypothetical protein N658DRAFT_510772 [Parathielavia hyrcaniae]|uniref:Uncharacterized protein n=1 Tax=Parathielavia hyrcaniae TaxID=113614 RepID=A0AAN6SXZ9_9PEZI|nr:hypothetical protein N658DRAFT_510772 [Parathielavia hyrcaniae]
METTPVTTPFPLAVARKPLGCATTTPGPLKSISDGFVQFFRALIFTIPIVNADAIDTLSHMDDITFAHPWESVVADDNFTDHKPHFTEEQHEVPRQFAEEMTAGGIDASEINMIMLTEAAVECTMGAGDLPLTTEATADYPAEDPATVGETEEPIATGQAAMPITEDTIMLDDTAPVAANKIGDSVTDITCVTSDNLSFGDVISESPVEPKVFCTDNNSADMIEKITDHESILDEEHQGPVPQDEPATAHIPLPVYPLVFEDDFDAAISSFLDANFERFIEADMGRSVPQVVEKGKAARDLLRERLVNPASALFNRQNLILERAARALSIMGTGPALAVAATSAAGAATPPTPATPTTPMSPIEPGEAPIESEPMVAEQEAVVSTKGEGGTEASLEARPDIADAYAGLAKKDDTKADRSHSRSTSLSSNDSKESTESAFDTAACPGTPATEYSTTLVKAEAPSTVISGEAFQHHDDADQHHLATTTESENRTDPATSDDDDETTE